MYLTDKSGVTGIYVVHTHKMMPYKMICILIKINDKH